MSKIDRSNTNVYDVPKGATIRSNGYVYVNTSNFWITSDDGKLRYPSHEKKCIGIIKDREHGKMYPNSSYFKIFKIDALPPPPERCDHIKVGLRALVDVICSDYDLRDLLTDSFGQEEANLILDLAMYMLGSESAVFQHFPAWAREHATYSEQIWSDSAISKFLGEKVTVSKINEFKTQWARKHIGNGRVYFCYDSTNVNSQAEGVVLVEKGHAKDDPSLEQVNMDYVIRQADGIPLTFTAFPGSIVDVAEAPEMIGFWGTLPRARKPEQR